MNKIIPGKLLVANFKKKFLAFYRTQHFNCQLPNGYPLNPIMGKLNRVHALKFLCLSVHLSIFFPPTTMSSFRFSKSLTLTHVLHVLPIT
jgi:hypothetical protein